MKYSGIWKSLAVSALACSFCLSAASISLAAEAARVNLSGHVPAVVPSLAPIGKLPPTKGLSLAIGLPLRNQPELHELLRQLYDADSANFHKYLTPAEFTARFGPTEADYQRVIRFVQGHGLTVTATHPNRVVLDVEGNAENIEQAFQITLRIYLHPTEQRQFFAPDVEPSVPKDVPVNDMWGLTDYALPTPLLRPIDPAKISPLTYNGTGPSGSYQGLDFRNAYVPGSVLGGSGQIAAVAEFDGYYVKDITNYEAACGYTNVPLQNVLIDNVSGAPGYSGIANAVAEVSLDIELLIAMAPALAQVRVYEGNNPYNVFNKIATENLAKQISCSWAWSTGPARTWILGHGGKGSTLDSILSQMVAQGQSFFQASGDSDAYTGSQALSSSRGPIPVDSIYVTSVGGTTLAMSGAGAAWYSETVWNWGNNTGSGGGVSPNYALPSWQTNVSMGSNNGSTVNRNIPDVALTADAINVIYNNGSSGVFGGTSCAAPLWAGFTALVNQQAAASGSASVGFLNPALYKIAASANYTACFHDVITGNNIGANTPGLYYAVTNYDLATGLGTPNGTNLINVLAPAAFPYFITQPVSQTVSNGADVTFTATAVGELPLTYQWLFNGTNLQASGNITGTTTNTLRLLSVSFANAGNYSLVVTNSFGAVTSSVASLTVTFPPAFAAQPTNLSVIAGSNAIFSATVSGALPLSYHWRTNGINLVNGGNISGATSNVLTISPVTGANAGNYTLFVTNTYGSATSRVATLTVLFPPTITVSPVAQTIQCGSNAAFTLTAAGTSPLEYQWSLDGSLISGATNTTLLLTNLHLPSHTVAVVVSNLYGSATSAVPLTVQDSLPPVITLNSTNPFYMELGAAYIEPGATAFDICAGVLPVTTNGLVSTSSVGTNLVTYSAADGNGNTSSLTRTIIVQDTTPPTILWSFTNLTLAADGITCTAAMPDVTTTNDIVAADLSGALTITQSPSNNAALPLGTNVVVITVADASGNRSHSTNQIIVLDQTPPMITDQPQNLASTAGATATFSVAATACTPLHFEWFFNDTALAGQTNSDLVLSNLIAEMEGNYFVVVTASGGSTTSEVARLTLNLLNSVLTLSSSENPSGFHDSLNLIAAVSPADATGTVQFFTNGVAFDLQLLVGGAAVSMNIDSLPRGTNQLAAVYSGDGNHQPATNSFEQIVTNHPPFALPAFYTLVAGLNLNITVTDLATNWSDLDGDLLSITDVSTSTNGVMVTNALPILFYSNTNYVNDQFVCTITDGYGGTNFQTISITIVLQTNSTPSISIGAVQPGGAITLNLSGSYGSTYILETTTNLVPANWESVVTNTPGLTGTWQFTDEQVTNSLQRFYRLKLVQ